MRFALFLAVAACTAPPPPGAAAYPGSTVRVPAEWEPQASVWLQWPQSWESTYEPTFARVVATILRHEHVHILTADAATRRAAVDALREVGGLSTAVVEGARSEQGFTLTWHDVPNDNAWMRDNGPRYVEVDGALRIQDWGFDAWGGAFGADIPFAADDAVPVAVGEHLGLPVDHVDLVHERGDLEFNGTDAVLLNWSVIGDPARNPGLTRADAEAAMRDAFGVSRVVLIEGVPEGDLTRGHIDGIARFVDAEHVIVADCSPDAHCQPGGPDDAVYDAAAATIADAGFEVLRWPFYGKVDYRDTTFDTDYMNWLVGNGFVIAAGFGHAEADAAARTQLQSWFPDREVYLIEALESWYAGGGIHCHTNDEPLGTPGTDGD